ncbi:MAG TPA: PhzF family phenazine biosynthesis protein [Candidatus Limnocylindrales bacterium]|nr:PhzF family phenazine biosynthesis protein [Candidatus Limnocylindrales bacterium]
MRAFRQVDVFGARPLLGNPLAVVVDAEHLSGDEMLGLTRWTNLSEAAFLLPPSAPEADYRVRIFTLAGELAFAGHPTLGSCHAWLEVGGQPRNGHQIIQQCGAGLVRLRRDPHHGMLSFAAPPLLRSGALSEEHKGFLARGLGLSARDIVDAAWVDNGPGWVGVLLRDAEAVLAVEPRFERAARGQMLDIGLVGPYPPGSECAIEVRGLFTDERGVLREDPVTGSLNASLAQWLIGSGRLTAPYRASQGTLLGREGRVHLTQDGDGTIWVGGATTTCIEGSIDM